MRLPIITINVGDLFGRLTIIGLLNKINKQGSTNRYARVKCICGVIKDVIIYDLNNGSTKSCGCLRKEMMTTHGMSNERLYDTWFSMIHRCTNENSNNFKNYGGRGISICEEWKVFDSFNNWAIENGYEDNLQIDRIDNDGDYKPSNCQWVTHLDNCGALKRRMTSLNTSGVTGVSFIKASNKWRVQININKKILHLGYYTSFEDAVNIRKQAEIDHKLIKG